MPFFDTLNTILSLLGETVGLVTPVTVRGERAGFIGKRMESILATISPWTRIRFCQEEYPSLTILISYQLGSRVRVELVAEESSPLTRI